MTGAFCLLNRDEVTPTYSPRGKLVEIQINDSVYATTPAYRSGALACRRGVSYRANPHRDGSQSHDDWNYGHDHEDCGYHHEVAGLQ